MNFHSNYIHSFVAGLFVVSASIFLSCQESVAMPHHGEFSEVHNPKIPMNMQFAGQNVSLDRVDMFERFDRELTSLIYSHGNTLLTLKRANKYFPVMAPILKKNGVPLDLLYLACVESYLNHRAYSPAKAAGFWQFLPSTGTQYGLEVSDEVDERYNLEKATEAACRYLNNAYRKYGDWATVMASYNGGMGRLSSELEKQQGKTFFDLYLTEETSRYVFRIMAMKAVLENPSAFGFRLTPEQFYQPVEYTTEEVSGPVEDWPAWAAERGLTYAQLREENPWIRSKKLTNKNGKTYQVRLPKKDSLFRSTNKKTLYNPNWAK
ncbi:MAG: lytic transglycosylase domain-containing protein [Muribaculaceae bacterium]|nr:lytic transglycosylase domain-containing protein [Muribaculaceae bacterium]